MGALRDEPLDLIELLEDTVDPASGGLAIFGGTVRNHHGGREVESLAYTAYPPVAERRIAEIEREACERLGASRCRILHRTGDLAIGDVAVWVVARAPHREEAFRAARWAIDEVKKTVPIWKEEHYADGTRRFVEACEDAGPGADGDEDDEGNWDVEDGG